MQADHASRFTQHDTGCLRDPHVGVPLRVLCTLNRIYHAQRKFPQFFLRVLVPPWFNAVNPVDFQITLGLSSFLLDSDRLNGYD
jgi:hypothetical protein